MNKKVNKKEKVEKKTVKKKKTFNLKLGPINKGLAFIIIAYFVFNVLSIFIGIVLKSYANFYWLNIRNPIMDVFYSIFKYIPFFGIHFHVIGFILIAIFALIISLLIDTNIISNEKVLNKTINICLTFVLIILIPFITVLSNAFSDRNNPRLNEKYFTMYKDKEYTKNDLIKINEYYRDKILLYINKFDRDEEGNVIYKKDVGLTAVNSLKKSSKKFNYLEGSFLDRFKTFSEREHKNNTDNVLGYSGAFGINYDPEFDPISLISILTHELCHTKGLSRECETVFCEVIANTEDDIDEVKYSGYIEAFNRVNYALYTIDAKESRKIEDTVTKYCLTDNYSEICNIYMKSVNYYEKGTDNIALMTYTLNQYEEYGEELLNIVKDLANDFDAKITINGKDYITVEELSNQMNSDDYAYIEINVDKEKFNKLQPHLIKYKRYFLGIRQESEDDEEPVERDSNESLKYYLSPFSGNDLLKSPMPGVKGGFIDEYDYERVSRILLEYYDTYGYN